MTAVSPTPGAPLRATQRIAADPTSTALLLAGPSAFELWPGVRRVADLGGGVVVETALAEGRAVAASVRALPPQRTPTAYVTRFTWVGPGLPATTGELVLTHAPAVPGERATLATLELTCDDLPGSDLDAATLDVMARAFLANLARAAELRNRAA